MSNDKPRLTAVAAKMKRNAMSTPREPVRVGLSGGLGLTLIFTLTRWKLSLARQMTQPSPKEVEICRRVFGVPDSATQETSHKIVWNKTEWWIIRITWNSSHQLSFEDMPDGAVSVTIEPGEDGDV